MDVPARPCLSASAAPTRTMDDPSRIYGSAFCTVKNTPLNSTSLSSSNSSSERLATGANLAIPALATRMSIGPNRSAVRRKRHSRSFRLRTSPCNANTSDPSAAAASSSVCRLRPNSTSLAPLAPNSRAVASPIPLLPPVITATLPWSLMAASTKLGQDADLLQQLHHGDLGPMLVDPAVLHAVDVNLAPLHRLVRGLLSHHRALMRCHRRASLHYPVAGGNQILLRHRHVRKRPVHHDAYLPQSFKTRR